MVSKKLDEADWPEFARVQLTGIEEAEKTYLSLLNTVFGVQEGASFYDDFPIWDPKYGKSETYGWLVRGEWVGGLKTRRAFLGSKEILCLGGIAMHPSRQGEGHASHLISSVLGSQDFDAAMLWAPKGALYERLGFEPWHEIGIYRIQSTGGALPQDPERAFQHRLKSPQGFRINQEDAPWYQNHKGTQWYGNKQATVAVNRGIDLDGLIHEWHGELPDLRKLILKTPASGVLATPDQAHELGLGEAEAMFPLAWCLPGRSGLAELDPWVWGLDAC